MSKYALVDKKGYFFAGEQPVMSPMWPTVPIYSKSSAISFETNEAAESKIKYGISPNHRQNFRVTEIEENLNIL